jgi:hypothetical protein
MPTRSSPIILGLAAGLLLAGASPAGAQNGITFDNGPSSKEYAIPLTSARSDAAAGASTHHGASSSTSAPLFGVGVHAKRPAPAHSRARHRTRHGHRAPFNSAPSGVSGSSGPPSAPRVRLTASTSGGLSSAATVGGLGLSVLLIGGVLGSVARRRRISP